MSFFPSQGGDCVFILCPQERSGMCVCELHEGDIRCVRETRKEKERKGKRGTGQRRSATRSETTVEEETVSFSAGSVQPRVEDLHPGRRSPQPQPPPLLKNGKMRPWLYFSDSII